MSAVNVSVRELQKSDIAEITHYWYTAEPAYLSGMGVDLSKIPKREDFENMLSIQLENAYEEKQSYCMIWLFENKPIGYSNINKIIFGEEAFMHLHLWEQSSRQKGLGTLLVQKTIPYFFENFQLCTLYCEPYALNPAPNKTLVKAGFSFVKQYLTTPGFLNFEQEVNLWEMSYDSYRQRYSSSLNGNK